MEKERFSERVTRRTSLRRGFTVEKSIKISDLLSVLTILISVVALLATISKDRLDRQREHADRVRSAAASMLIRVDRWQALQLGLYQELQPTFVELSEQLLVNYNTRAIRDQFWKKVEIERSKIAAKVVEEQLGSSYAELVASFPVAREKFLETNINLAKAEREVSESFLATSEARILRLQNQRESYETAVLGGALRDAATFSSAELKKRSDVAAAALRVYLLSVIGKDDAAILQGAARGS